MTTQKLRYYLLEARSNPDLFFGLTKGGHNFSELAVHGTPTRNRIASQDPSSKKTRAI
jgi:hypothetical protein